MRSVMMTSACAAVLRIAARAPARTARVGIVLNDCIVTSISSFRVPAKVTNAILRSFLPRFAIASSAHANASPQTLALRFRNSYASSRFRADSVRYFQIVSRRVCH